MSEYIQVDNYVCKCRAYPTKEQKEKIDAILHGIKVAYNMTAYSISHSEEAVTKVSKKDNETKWPDFSACMKKQWLDVLRENEAVKEVPSTSLSSSVYGIFTDMKKSWEKSKLPADKWKPEFYNSRHPRRSFTIQAQANAFSFTEGKAVFVPVTNVGKVKVRGFRHDLRYGDAPKQTFAEFYSGAKKAFGVTVSKDNCGDYWVSIKLQSVWKPIKENQNHIPLGVDVGIKDVAITSDGTKYENKKFKRREKRHIRRLCRKISRRQGWSNIKFREARKFDDSLVPSHSYESTVLKKAKLERKIARQRNDWNHNISADIVSRSEFIGIEDLLITGMMKNRHLAYSASDAAMGDVLSKLRYKAEWNKVPIIQIGRFEPSSQLCSVCGYRNKETKNLRIREWTCPECGSHLDRDINAARNILAIAQRDYKEMNK